MRWCTTHGWVFDFKSYTELPNRDEISLASSWTEIFQYKVETKN